MRTAIQGDLFATGNSAPPPASGYYKTMVNAVHEITSLPYRPEVFEAIRRVTCQGRWVCIGEIHDAVGEPLYSVVKPHMDYLKSTDCLNAINCFFGSEWPGPGSNYKGFQIYYRWRDN